ncbi:hypothetical protein DFH09DRAFT_1087390 [Mycena vulgaris]|nr:hypothetical protein DFH09DRAFT_1087390 [Mycena vulgaris]
MGDRIGDQARTKARGQAQECFSEHSEPPFSRLRVPPASGGVGWLWTEALGLNSLPTTLPRRGQWPEVRWQEESRSTPRDQHVANDTWRSRRGRRKGGKRWAREDGFGIFRHLKLSRRDAATYSTFMHEVLFIIAGTSQPKANPGWGKKDHGKGCRGWDAEERMQRSRPNWVKEESWECTQAWQRYHQLYEKVLQLLGGNYRIFITAFRRQLSNIYYRHQGVNTPKFPAWASGRGYSSPWGSRLRLPRDERGHIGILAAHAVPALWIGREERKGGGAEAGRWGRGAGKMVRLRRAGRWIWRAVRRCWTEVRVGDRNRKRGGRKETHMRATWKGTGKKKEGSEWQRCGSAGGRMTTTE